MTSPLDPGAPPASEARSSPESSTASAGSQEEAREGNAGVGNPFESPDVRIITTPDARKFILVGTAHVSRESTELVRRVVEAAQPDGVCIELDPGRYAALSQPQRFEQLDLRQVLAARQLPTLFANLLLASFQHSLGMKLGVRPGSELLEGARAAEAIGKPFHLCDREVRQTLKRAWAALSLWKKSLLAGALVVFAYAGGNVNFARYLGIPYVASIGEICVICGSLVGAGLGFLWFNTYPAQVFMGDVGALALGATLGTVAVLIRQELVLFIMGGVFVMETVSVMLQVASFKLTGKRIFAMAPLHHHFELKGWPEPRVIVRFWIITFILVLVGLASLKIR